MPKAELDSLGTRILALDTEASPDTTYLSEIAWLVYSADGQALSAYHASIVAPGRPTSEHASSYTVGADLSVPLTTKEATLEAVLNDLTMAVLGNLPLTLVAHNVEWDAKVVREAERQTGLKTGLCDLPRICTMLGTIEKYGSGWYMSLSDLFQALFGHQLEKAHDALADAVACAQCFWFLTSQGEYSGYVHLDAVRKWVYKCERRLHRRRRWELEREARLRNRKLIAREAAQAALYREASEASKSIGGIDRLVLERIRHLTPDSFEAFMQRYRKLYSPSAATYIRNVLTRSDPYYTMKPETSWRCLAAYCFLATADECLELAVRFLLDRPKLSKQVSLELGSPDSSASRLVHGSFDIPPNVRNELLCICGGNSELLPPLNKAYCDRYQKERSVLEALLKRGATGDTSACGTHTIELPYARVTLTINRASILRKLVAFIGEVLR